ELEHGPAALSGNPAQLAIGVDGKWTANSLQEREIGVAVGVRRALLEVEALVRGERTHAVGLGFGVQRPQGTSGVAAVPHLADRAESAVEAEIVRDRLHDLLQCGRDDV